MPLFTDEHLDVPLDYESVAKAGSMLGTRSLQLFDETTCVVRVAAAVDPVLPARVLRQMHPVPGGQYWVSSCWSGWSTARAATTDLDKLLDICDNITGPGVLCPGRLRSRRRSASSIKYFRDEYLEHQKHGGCPFDPAASTLVPMEPPR